MYMIHPNLLESFSEYLLYILSGFNILTGLHTGYTVLPFYL